MIDYKGSWLELAEAQTVTKEDLVYDASYISLELPSALLVVAKGYKHIVWC